MSSRYDVLLSGESESEDDNDDIFEMHIPSYEDLSLLRNDEETVLKAVYEKDYSFDKKRAQLNIHIRPPDLDSVNVGSELTLSVKLSKRYPYEVPMIDFKTVRGLNSKEKKELLSKLLETAKALSVDGSVMMCELVQVAEDYILLHNRDPSKENMSAWEQMMEREKALKEKSIEEEKEREKKLKSFEMIADDTSEISSSNILKNIEVERGLVQQLEALEATKEEDDSSHSNDFVELDDDYNACPRFCLSRYQTDFIELGLLGRGGGGEVMKVRNRLDRRLYAIKKIVLFDESGKNDRFVKFCRIQNGKLRREVTTISKMTHKNIVRYYQAWVEGGIVENGEETSSINNNDESKQDSSYSSSDGPTWWAKPDNCGFSFDNDDNSDTTMSAPDFDLPENDFDEIFHKSESSPSCHIGESFDSSGFEVPNSMKKVLHIQMEYCSTTLRHAIDGCTIEKMDAKDIFVLARQTLEALAYIHSQKLIHRDL